MDVREVVARIANGGPVRPVAGGYMTRCPAHEDGTPSLSISEGSTQPVLLFCHGGCTPEAILEAAGLTWEEISAPKEERPVTARATSAAAQTIYPYRDAEGKEVFQVVRSVARDGSKKFLQRQPDGSGGWVWNLQGVTRVLYRLPEVLGAVATGQAVWITEGEKDANALVEIGLCATTSSGGAGKWRDEYADALSGAEVWIVADRDTKGREHARQVFESVKAAGGYPAIVESAHGKDAFDHLAGGGTPETFVITKPRDEEQRLIVGKDLDEYIDQVLPPQRFVVPHTLAESEVWMVTGYEGHGKSMLLKQVAVQVATGYHPFRSVKMEPRKVLVVDCENATRDSQADFNLLRRTAIDGQYVDWKDREKLIIEEPGPIDLFRESWREWLMERVRAEKPDLVICGPIYRMVGRDLREEDSVRALMHTITDIQRINGCAVILEHHVAKANLGERGLDPLGSGLFLRWCNFITGLRPITIDGKDTGVYTLEHQRKGRVRSRTWPTHLRWGQGIEWPWEPMTEAEAEAALVR